MPMNMLAAGGGPDVVAEKGEEAGAGRESNFTRTSRWRSRLSVKKRAWGVGS